MSEIIANSETDILHEAVKSCLNTSEEEGGVILVNPDKTQFQYIKIRNTNTGTPTANVLWTADRDEYALKVIPLYSQGWRQYASFHTHPRFLPLPSGIDYRDLFPGFPINFIYSTMTKEITKWNAHTGQPDRFWLASYHVHSVTFDETTQIKTHEEPTLEIHE